MPSISEDRKALEFASKQVGTPPANKIAGILGLDSDDLKAYDWSTKNPESPEAIKVRNTIFTKIAQSRPAEDMGFFTTGGAKAYERLWAKNVIDQDPKVQETYFQKKGYDTRYFKNNLEVRKPGDTNFKPVDPDQIDAFDAFDLISDTIEGIAAGVAQGTATVIGSTAATPAVGVPAGFAASGGVTAAAEATRQGFSRLTGVRDNFDEGAIVKAGALGALIPAAVKGASALVKGTNKAIDKIVDMATERPLLADNAAEIQTAAKVLGVEATPEQYFNDRDIARSVGSLNEFQFTLFGQGIRKQKKFNERETDTIIDGIFKNRDNRSKVEIGEQVSESISKQVKDQAKIAEKIYQTFEPLFNNRLTKPDLDSVKTFLEQRASKSFSDDEIKVANSMLSKIEKVNSLDDLKELRSSVGELTDMATNPSKNGRILAGEIYKRLTAVRQNTLKDLASRAISKGDDMILLTPGKDDGLMKLIQASGKGTDFFQFAYDELKSADKIWADIYKTADDLGMGKKLAQRFTGKEVVDEYFSGKKLEKVADLIFDTSDIKKLRKLESRFPAEFETLRKVKQNDIFQRAKIRVNSGPEKVTPANLSNAISKIDTKTREMIFGLDAPTIDALIVWGKSNPIPINPSKTDLLNMVRVPQLLKQNFGAALQAGILGAKTRNIIPNKKPLLEKVSSILDAELGFKSKFGVVKLPVVPAAGVTIQRSRSGEDRKELLPDAAMGILPEYNKQGWR